MASLSPTCIKLFAPRDRVFSTPLASNFSRASGTGGDTKIERSPAKNGSPAVTPREGPSTDTTTRRGQSNEAITAHPERVDALYQDADSYFYHVRRLGEHVDLTITACFLALPVVSLLWSVLCFTIAIAAFCIQGTNMTSEILLVTLLGLLGFFASVTPLFFWHIWRSPRRNEIEEDFNMDTILNVDPLQRLHKAEMAVQELIKSLQGCRRGKQGDNSGTKEATQDTVPENTS